MLKATNIIKSYSNYDILKGVSLELRKGERVALAGGSGVGKSTLIHILAGLDTDCSGNVECNTERKRVVFQDCGLFSHKTLKQNIFYLLAQTSDMQSSYESWLEVCCLKEVENSYPFQLSRGMKQKVAIIRAFLAEPELIFLDEPFSGIDSESTKKIVDYIMIKYPDITLLVASHSRLPEQFCSGRLLLYQDRIEKA